MALIPRFLTVKQRAEALGPTIPAPERYVAPTGEGSGRVMYNVGDPVPVNIARALGWLGANEEPLREPEPTNASSRGRKIRAADREQRSRE